MMLPLTLAALTLSGHVRVWHVFILATCLGIVNAFDIPARQSFVVEMVGREDLINAIALNSSMVNGARVVGPGGRGPAGRRRRRGLVLSDQRRQLHRRDRRPAADEDRRRGGRATRRGRPARDTIDGFRFVARTAPIHALLLLLGVVSFAGMPYSVLMPVFAEVDSAAAGRKGLGLLMGASGLGALGGALSLAARRGVRGLGRWVAVSAARVRRRADRLLAVAHVLAVGAAADPGRRRDDGARWPRRNTLIQAMVPDALRGRVMALYSMMFMGMAPFGALFAGWVAERFGAPMTVALGGVVCLVAGDHLLAAPADDPDRGAGADRRAGDGRRRSGGRDDRNEPLSPLAPAAESASRSRRGTSAASPTNANS